MLTQSLLGLGLTGHALAALISREHSRVMSWCGVVAATGWFVTAAARFTRPAEVAFEFVLPFAGLTSVWVIWLAVSVLRSSRVTRSPGAA